MGKSASNRLLIKLIENRSIVENALKGNVVHKGGDITNFFRNLVLFFLKPKLRLLYLFQLLVDNFRWHQTMNEVHGNVVDFLIIVFSLI